MDRSNHRHENGSGRPPFLTSPAGIALAMVGVIIAFFVLREHWQHVVGNLPYLLLLACPLMHLFGHGHGGHGRHAAPDNGRDESAIHDGKRP